MTTLDEALAIHPQPELHDANNKLVCYLCCQNGQMFCDQIDGSLVFICEDHLRLVLANGKILAAQTLGVRN